MDIRVSETLWNRQPWMYITADIYMYLVCFTGKFGNYLFTGKLETTQQPQSKLLNETYFHEG